MNQHPEILRNIPEDMPPEIFEYVTSWDRLQFQGLWKHSLGVDFDLTATSAVSEYARLKALWSYGFALMLRAEAGDCSIANAIRYRDGCLMALLSMQDGPLEDVAAMQVIRDSNGCIAGAQPWTEPLDCAWDRAGWALATERMTTAMDRYAMGWRRFLDTEMQKKLWLTPEGEPLSADRIRNIVFSHLEGLLRQDRDEVARGATVPSDRRAV